MRLFKVTVLFMSLIVFLPLSGTAGDIDSPAPPDDPAAAMYSLEALYDWVDQGLTPTKRSGGFVEPESAPGSSTHTLNDLWDRIKYIGRVPKTGQSNCYDAAGNEIDCSGTGQDGEYQTGVAPPTQTGAQRQTAGRYYTDNGDGTVTHNTNGLIWLKNANCFDARTWEDALTAAKNFKSGSCGVNDGSQAGDWRLPNINELGSLVAHNYTNPSLSNADGSGRWTEGDAFTGVKSDAYWSSTTYDEYPDYAWCINFYNGNKTSYGKTYTQYIWLVKGGN